jgi:hypothetical protein
MNSFRVTLPLQQFATVISFGIRQQCPGQEQDGPAADSRPAATT